MVENVTCLIGTDEGKGNTQSYYFSSHTVNKCAFHDTQSHVFSIFLLLFTGGFPVLSAPPLPPQTQC